MHSEHDSPNVPQFAKQARNIRPVVAQTQHYSTNTKAVSTLPIQHLGGHSTRARNTHRRSPNKSRAGQIVRPQNDASQCVKSTKLTRDVYKYSLKSVEKWPKSVARSNTFANTLPSFVKCTFCATKFDVFRTQNTEESYLNGRKVAGLTHQIAQHTFVKIYVLFFHICTFFESPTFWSHFSAEVGHRDQLLCGVKLAILPLSSILCMFGHIFWWHKKYISTHTFPFFAYFACVRACIWPQSVFFLSGSFGHTYTPPGRGRERGIDVPNTTHYGVLQCGTHCNTPIINGFLPINTA